MVNCLRVLITFQMTGATVVYKKKKTIRKNDDERELFIHKKKSLKKNYTVAFRENIGLMMSNRYYYIIIYIYFFFSTGFENDYLLVLIISAVRFNCVHLYT